MPEDPALAGSILVLGFVIGMQHAFEADHLAAVSSLVSRERGLARITRLGAAWGFGHTLALILLSSFVLFTSWSLPPSFGPGLEIVVGVVLVSLGARLLYRLRRDRVHVHVHRHRDGAVHLHAHSHRDECGSHAESDHDHHHPATTWRTLVVGLLHGAAGSATLTVYVAASLESPATGLLYVLLFGLGSIVGMAALSVAIAVPLVSTARRLTWANQALQIAVGLASIAIGLRLALAQAVGLGS